MSDTLINNILNRIQPNSRVLFVWTGNQVPEKFENVIERIRERVANSEQKVSVENSERLTMSSHPVSSFDMILSNLLTSDQANHSPSVLSIYIKVLKPTGSLIIVDQKDKSASLQSELKLNGFLNLNNDLNEEGLSMFSCEKPNFEVGSVKKLSFASKTNPEPVENKVGV
jgi:hypothetical protein